MRMNRTIAVVVITMLVIVGIFIWIGLAKETRPGIPNFGGKDVTIHDAGIFPIADRPIELEVFVGSSFSQEDLKNNWFTTYLEQKLGIELIFITANPTTLDDAENVMFASGDYSPVILGGSLTPDEQVKYGRRGILRPLNELIDKYGDRIQEVFQENPELEQSITALDGNLYALPSVNECIHCWYSQKLWINKTWLNQLNLDMPKTTDELYQVLRSFKLEDPNGNGVQDEIPLSGAVNSWHTEITGFLMSAFIYNTDTHYLYIEDGEVGMAAIQPEWRDGLDYLHKLYSEDLIDPQVFTQSDQGLLDTATREVNQLGAVTAGHIRMVFEGDEWSARHSEYEAVPPLIGPSGYQAAGYFGSFDRATFAITDKATDAEAAAAIRLADFLWTEEASVYNEWGPENKWWRKGQPGEFDEHGRPAKYWLSPDFSATASQNDVWAQLGILYRDRDLRESWAVPEDSDSILGYEHRLYQETLEKYEGKEPAEVYPDYIFMEQDDAEEVARLKETIHEYVRSNMVQFITGKKNTSVDWDDYVTGLKNLKLDRYVEIHQRAYNTYRR
jgi:putative aldouronate transport system substrate-binding protein